MLCFFVAGSAAANGVVIRCTCRFRGSYNPEAEDLMALIALCQCWHCLLECHSLSFPCHLYHYEAGLEVSACRKAVRPLIN